MKHTLTYADNHVHTNRSTGKHDLQTIVNKAIDAGIGILCVADHDILAPDDLSSFEKKGLRLLRGTELSCSYLKRDGKSIVIHIIACNYHAPAPALEKIAAFNRIQKERSNRSYYENIRKKLNALDLDIGSYDALLQKKGLKQLEKKDIAMELSEQKHIPLDKIYEDYLSTRGKQLCYVPDETEYIPYQIAIDAILKENGIPILCHPLKYQLADFELLTLIEDFRQCCHDAAAGMETMYGHYTAEQVQTLQALCRGNGLYESVGSDYHGISPSDTLLHRFPISVTETLLQAQKKQTL